MKKQYIQIILLSTLAVAVVWFQLVISNSAEDIQALLAFFTGSK